jgi:hypothetical protein
LLHAVEVPSAGADTQFTNMYMAYAALPADVRALIDDLKVVHEYDSISEGDACCQAVGSGDGRDAGGRSSPGLYTPGNRPLCPLFARIVGFAQRERPVSRRIHPHATQQKYQYRHPDA